MYVTILTRLQVKGKAMESGDYEMMDLLLKRAVTVGDIARVIRAMVAKMDNIEKEIKRERRNMYGWYFDDGAPVAMARTVEEARGIIATENYERAYRNSEILKSEPHFTSDILIIIKTEDY